MRQSLQTHWPAILIVVIALVIGLDIYQDFGVSIDETSQREIGLAAYNYARGYFPGNYHDFTLRDHGPGFEWIYLFFEKSLNLTKMRDILLSRHLITYIFFVLTTSFIYIWIYRVFVNRWLAAFGLAALLFHPVIFGHAFFNPKDIPAMCIFLLSMAAVQWAFSSSKMLPYLILGLICGYSTTFRLLNIIVLLPIGLFFIIDLFAAFRKGNAQRVVIAGLLVLAGTCITLYTFWPTLWEDPIAGMQYIYETNSKYPWDGILQFGGMQIRSTNLPWSYIPTWFFITTPEMILLSGIIGVTFLVVRVIDEPAHYCQNTPKRSILLAFICFLLPIIVVVCKDAVLYDGWRHMYFIYPGFVMLAVFGFSELLKNRSKLILWSLCILQFIFIARFMIKNHPFEHVYFNSFVSHEEDYLMNNYELDYWGTSHKQGLEWLAQYDRRYGIKLYEDMWTIRDNHSFLNEALHPKFVFTKDINEAEYHLQFFRTHPYWFPNEKVPAENIIYEKRVSGSPIYRIVKLR